VYSIGNPEEESPRLGPRKRVSPKTTPANFKNNSDEFNNKYDFVLASQRKGKIFPLMRIIKKIVSFKWELVTTTFIRALQLLFNTAFFLFGVLFLCLDFLHFLIFISLVFLFKVNAL